MVWSRQAGPVSLGHRPGSKLLTLVHTLVSGGDCIADAAMLQAGATGQVLDHKVMASSTLGTWMRAATFGHLRQIDRVTELAMTRAWAAGAGPGDAPMFIDIDSTICEVHGHQKQGASYGYTRQIGLHPLLASRADTGEIVTNQIWDLDPPETWVTARRLTALGYDRHEVIHMLGGAVTTQLWRAMHEQEPFDLPEFLADLDALPDSWEERRLQAEPRRRTRRRSPWIGGNR